MSLPVRAFLEHLNESLTRCRQFAPPYPRAVRDLPHRRSLHEATTKATPANAASGEPAGGPKFPTKFPTKAQKSKLKPKAKAFEVAESHRDIIKVLHSRRHQLRAQILRLKQKELAAFAASIPRPDTPKRSTSLIGVADHRPDVLLPPSSRSKSTSDRCLDVLSSLHVGDTVNFEQDHLSNVSDFRVQAKPDAPAIPKKQQNAPKKAPNKSSAAVERRVAVDLEAKAAANAALKDLNLRNLNKSLKSYILACDRADWGNQGLPAVAFYREKYPSAEDRGKLLDVGLCNVILTVSAKRGKISQVKDVFRWMKTDGIHPNVKSFASALEAMGRQKTLDMKMARRIVNQMQQEKIALNDLFIANDFVMDQKERVLDVIHAIQPNFRPNIPLPESGYDLPILHSLNGLADSPLKDTPYRGVIDYETFLTQFKEQIQREMAGAIAVKSVDFAPKHDARVLRCREKLEKLKKYWAATLTESFERNIEQLKQQLQRKRGVNIYPFLCGLTTEAYVEILIQELVRLAQSSEGYSPTTLVLYMQLGNRVMDKYMMKCKIEYQLVERTKMLYREYLKYFEDPSAVGNFNCRQFWQKLECDMEITQHVDLSDHIWPDSVVIRIGRLLFDMIVNDIKIDTTALRLVEQHQYAPTLYKVYRHYGEMLKEEVKPHPVLAKLYKASMQEELTFDAVMCPTIVPPLPWTNSKSGGYLLQRTFLTRLPEIGDRTTKIVDRVPAKQIYPILDSLNQLGASPWIINKPMLDLVISVFQNKGMAEVDIPPPTSVLPPFPKITRDLDAKQKLDVYRERFALKRRRNEMFSLWCDALYKLSIANHFRDAVFWFPHNIDFRGRVYPVPPHFHHLGGDMSRCILLFAKGMPLGENGLDWLKIHCINLTGLKKKSSIADRLSYANEIIHDILDSAENPLTGRQWWKNSDDPWQTLACCKEIERASRTPDPTKFISHFPIHQDGSCNGLQHYAALGRDTKGADQVNLSPHDVPQDVYSGVAALVEKERAMDARHGVEMAASLEGFVSRKVVKQTVMTIVYGVTKYGAKAQIQRQLADIKEFPENKAWGAAAYLAGRTFDCIKQMFTATRQIQDWFVDCARLVSTVREKPIEWVTPLGLPVIQPYFKPPRQASSHTMHLALDPGKPNTMKQKNAFPPNFIHSLDSSHMMLTCLHAGRVGMSFVSVHDSFWTHPITVDTMNKITREQFVALHSLPILEDLSANLVQKFAFDKAELGSAIPDDPRLLLNHTLKKVPSKGDFPLNSVLKSIYFFS